MASEREIAEVASGQLAALFRCNTVLLGGGPALKLLASAPGPVQLGAIERAAAALALDTGHPSGRGVTRGNASEWQFHAVGSAPAIAAIVGLARDDGLIVPGPAQELLLENLLDQVALALERARLEGEARQFTAVRERDRIRSALLATIGEASARG